MTLSDITFSAVVKAIQEYEEVGKEAFLESNGFGDSKKYWILRNGNRYPSKAIAGAAHRFIDGKPLSAASFSGGDATVVQKLKQLGFEVEELDRNPNWTRDELILALDLYFANPTNLPGKSSAEILALSSLLNKMHRLTGGEISPTFRNPNGVYMKLMNIRALDPTYTQQGKVGMMAGGKLEKVIWAEYAGRTTELQSNARAIRDALSNANETEVAKLPAEDYYEGEEGGVLISLHRRYERDRKLIDNKKKAAKASGEFSCEVCGFDFEKTYGALGADFIEVHHTKPVHLMTSGTKTRLTDLALLCSNCHRMAHRKRTPLTLDQIRHALEPKDKT
jgi:5-methylcytosine-specific restriction protein A